MSDIVDDTAPVVVNQNVDATAGAIGAIPAIIEEAKAGYKTTEFWLAVAISILTVLDGIPLPEKYEGFVVTLLGIAYALSRGIAKAGVANVTPIKDAA